LKLKRLLKKYFAIDNNLLHGNIIKEENAIIFSNTHNELFQFHGKMIDDIIIYCRNNDVDIDRIVFMDCYNMDILKHPEKMSNASMHDESLISIIEKDNKRYAVVFVGSNINFKEK